MFKRSGTQLSTLILVKMSSFSGIVPNFKLDFSLLPPKKDTLESPDVEKFKLDTPEVVRMIWDWKLPELPNISPLVKDLEPMSSLEKRRANNRDAARRCRQKKLDHLRNLEKRKRELLDERRELNKRIFATREHVNYLVNQLGMSQSSGWYDGSNYTDQATSNPPHAFYSISS